MSLWTPLFLGYVALLSLVKNAESTSCAFYCFVLPTRVSCSATPLFETAEVGCIVPCSAEGNVRRRSLPELVVHSLRLRILTHSLGYVAALHHFPR